MGLFTRNEERNQEEDGELGNCMSELMCEEAIIKDKERFGRVRTNMMRVLRTKYGNDEANRALNRINKRIQDGSLINKINT